MAATAPSQFSGFPLMGAQGMLLCTFVLAQTSEVTHEEFTCMENSDILPKVIRLIPELSSLYLKEKKKHCYL